MFKIGDMVRCERSILFLDGSSHFKGKYYTVTEETLAYFIVNKGDYTLTDINLTSCKGKNHES